MVCLFVCEKWYVSCRISKQRMPHLHQWLPPSIVSWWALRELRKERISASSSHQTAATPYSEPWGNSGCENTGYWLQIAEVLIIGMISLSPDSCIFSCTEKCWILFERRNTFLYEMRNTSILLTWDIWFQFTKIFGCSDYLPFVAKLLCKLTPPFTSLEQLS